MLGYNAKRVHSLAEHAPTLALTPLRPLYTRPPLQLRRQRRVYTETLTLRHVYTETLTLRPPSTTAAETKASEEFIRKLQAQGEIGAAGGAAAGGGAGAGGGGEAGGRAGGGVAALTGGAKGGGGMASDAELQVNVYTEE